MTKKVTINTELVKHINENIIPIYENFDKGHQKKHLNHVWESCQEIVKNNKLDINPDMLYTVVHYHDVGLSFNRKQHHLYSAKLLKADKFINHLFPHQDITIMAEAIEDHRASNDYEPRNIYGKIVADGDRQIDIDVIMKRYCWALFTGHNTDFPPNYQELSKQELFDQIVYPGICNKYGGNGEAGYVSFNFEHSPMQKELTKIKNMTKTEMYNVYDKNYDEIAK